MPTNTNTTWVSEESILVNYENWYAQKQYELELAVEEAEYWTECANAYEAARESGTDMSHGIAL